MLLFEVFTEYEDTVLCVQTIIGFSFKVGLSIIEQRNKHLGPANLFVPGDFPETSGFIVEGNIFIIQLNFWSDTQELFNCQIHLTLNLYGHKILFFQYLIVHGNVILRLVQLVSLQVKIIVKFDHFFVLLL